MDTARFKYGPHWVPLPLLFDAMQPIDPDSGKSRGFVLLSYQHDDDPVMPMSILLRSKKAQNPVRRLYKQYLEDHNHDTIITWDQVVDFWTKGGTKPAFVWEIMEPQLFPTEAETSEAIEGVRALVRTLLLPHGFFSNNNNTDNNSDEAQECRPNGNRVIPLLPEEAIMIVYLASLPLEQRKELVMNAGDHAPELTRQQLLVEVELVQYAIDVSDELEQEDAIRIRHEQDSHQCCGRNKNKETQEAIK